MIIIKKLLYLSLLPLLFFINSQKIKNSNFPSCKKCIYYKVNSNFDFDSNFNKCNYFGEKNIINGEIKYDYVDICRNNESMCGKEGKYFIEEPNLKFKIFKFYFTKYLPYSINIIPIIIIYLLVLK